MLYRHDGKVSIPIGFSSSLQLREALDESEQILAVSIPIGFSSSLQHCDGWTLLGLSAGVSIPIGFSSSLQPNIRMPAMRAQVGFNPYRVFKFVATPI